jgi:putative transposase
MKQTTIYKLKPNFEQEKHLHNLASIATKLYNTDNWQRREQWKLNGKIPNAYTQKKALRLNHWYKLLPSQTAQEVCFVLQRNYCSWYKLRKTGKAANPPMFRKKTILSVLSFYQQFKIVNDKMRFVMSKKYRAEQNIKVIEIPFDRWKMQEGIPKYCQIIFKKGEWFAHVVYDVQEKSPILNNGIMAVDLGIINTATTVDTTNNAKIYSGKEVLAIQHYFNKEKAKLESALMKQYPKRHKSRVLRILQDKQSRQINQSLHTHSKKIITDCIDKRIKTLVVGDVTNIRKNKNFGHKTNQKLHSWSFSKFTQMLEYKAIRAGIRFVRVNEAFSSQTCSACRTICKKSRKHRGLYCCKTCGNVINADVNGALNILKKYLRDFLSRSIGSVAMPSVVRNNNVVPYNI